MKTNIISKLTALALAAGLSFTITSPTSADAAVFAKFDGIDGEATDSDHRDWIQVDSLDWGIHRPGGGATGQSRRRGAVIVEDVRCSKELDKASPKLMEACLTGRIIPKLEIEFTKNVGGAEVVYLRYEMKNVFVTSTAVHHQEGSSAAGTSNVPTDSFSLNFEEIKVTYSQYNEDGSLKGNVETSWKIEEGEA